MNTVDAKAQEMSRPAETDHQATSADGTIIGYRTGGTDRPLLFVHGTSTDHRSWLTVSSYLEEQATVHLMDRRGRGMSGDSAEYDLVREAEDVAAVVEAIGSPVGLFGHSFGGLCSLEAVLLTDHVSHLILYEPAIPNGMSTVPPGVFDRIEALVEQGELESAMENFLRKVAQITEHDLEVYRQSPLWEARIPVASTIPREMIAEDTYVFDAEKFARLQVPVLLLQGENSPQMYRQTIEILDSALPDSRVVVLPGQQHLAHHTSPELLAKELRQFVQE